MEFITKNDEEKNSNVMEILSNDIISIIISFIGITNKYNCKFININSDITNLYSINKHYHNHRIQYNNDYYYIFSKEYSYRFYNNKYFRRY